MKGEYVIGVTSDSPTSFSITATSTTEQESMITLQTGIPAKMKQQGDEMQLFRWFHKNETQGIELFLQVQTGFVKSIMIACDSEAIMEQTN